MNTRALCFVVITVLCATWISKAHAQQKYKKLPPDGIKIDAKVREELTVRVAELTDKLDKAVEASSDADAWRPDVQVLIRAVDLALKQNLFFKKNHPQLAGRLLDEVERRLALVKVGKRGLDLCRVGARNDAEPALVVGGFVSKIDDSVQPYGLVLPVGYAAGNSYRCDVWLHGRGDTTMEVAFLDQRMNKVGLYAPKDTIVLHPFGRHCNAFKFAGETDVYESLAHVESLCSLLPGRKSIRGFSMGGAGCWHLAVHDPTQWFAANPGAGFVDTIRYQKWTENVPFDLAEARTSLMQLYDVLPWIGNLKNTKLIAYSGEVDKQRQAADRVVEQAKKQEVDYEYIIGAKMGHKVDEPSKKIISKQLDDWAAEDLDSPRKKIDFTTYTLRYSRAGWLTITGVQQQWKRSHVHAEITEAGSLKIDTEGVTHLRLDFADSGWPGKQEVGLNINGERFYISDQGEAAGLQCDLALDKQWAQIVGDDQGEIRKRPGLQGPIDDAFRDRFVFVEPSRPAANGVVQRWINREMNYAKKRWQRLMRGNVRVVKDVDVTDEQIANCHLICFGDFLSNRYLNKMASRLPVQWTRDKLTMGGQSFDPANHAPVFCFPNPKNPQKYIVVNSGMTFREFSNVSNSRQIAMLPDWAVLKVSDKHDDSIFAGEIAAEGFFDEYWQVK